MVCCVNLFFSTPEGGFQPPSGKFFQNYIPFLKISVEFEFISNFKKEFKFEF